MHLAFTSVCGYDTRMDRRGITRFMKYVVAGGTTFAFDLVLLYVLVDGFGMYAPVAAGGAFLVALSVNYVISRRYVFRGTLRSVRGGYLGFLLIAGSGLCIVTGGMYALITYGAVPYLYARIIVAGTTGIWNYLLNLYVNFKVAGVHTGS